MNKIDLAYKKAELISNNNIFIPKEIKLVHPLSKSNAGPTSGSLSIGFSFYNRNIKMNVSKSKKQTFCLVKKNDIFNIEKEGEIYLKNISILPILFHAPNQAFINIENRCIYNCGFCYMPHHRFLEQYNDIRYIKTVINACKRYNLHAVVLTSGVYPNIPNIINRICLIIKMIKQEISNIPFGVEACIDNKSELLLLKKTGVDELKLNLQIADEHLFNKICPGFNYDKIFNLLEESVKIFGWGKVTSNIIYGLGESFESIINTIENLAKIGVVPTLRVVRINNFNKKKIEKILLTNLSNVDPIEILEVAKQHKRILEKNNLTTKTFNTMCHKCGCCDLVPFWDI